MAADVAKLTNAGLDIITNLLSGLGGTIPKWIHWGTGTTPATVTDTAMETAGTEARAEGTASRVTTTVTNDTLQVVGTLVCNATAKAITEVGAFDALTGSNLFGRITHDAIGMTENSSIEYTIKTKFADGT